MYTCELCGKQTKEGYMIVDLKFKKVLVVCRQCGRSNVEVRVDKDK